MSSRQDATVSSHEDTLEQRVPPSESGWTRVISRTTPSDLGSILAGTVLPFALIVYLALQGGGYDAVVRSEIGVAVWWLVLLGAIVGALPTMRLKPEAWVGIGALTAFAAWTALGITWSQSEERSFVEVARVATLLGAFVLVMGAQGRDGLRRIIYSVGAALGLVGLLAVLSRLHPSWFPADEAGAVFNRARLNYPVNYWNGLAALMAIGTPLLLAIAVDARRIATRALATAAVPVMALAAFYTLSRGGAVEFAAVLIAFGVLYPRRLEALPTVALAALGGGLLIAAATQRDALEDGLSTQAALDQGNEMIAIVLVICVGVALLRAALGLADKHELLPRPRIGRRAAAVGAGVGLTALFVVAVAAGAPGELSDRWEEFKQPLGPEAGATAERFESANGSGRYQHWEATLDANSSDPLVGIGPGTYEYFWAREGSLPTYVRDAHSLFFETLAELGVIGLLLIGGVILWILGVGAMRSFRSRPTDRPWFAAATTGCIAFTVAATIDWAWELTVIPVAFLLLAAALLAGRGSGERRPLGGIAARIALGALSVLALAGIAVPLAGTYLVRASQDAVNSGRLGPALEDAREATEIQPWAATPHLQQAFVLELQGDLNAAATAARAATGEEPTNWRTWLVLSRIEAYRGRPQASISAFREARGLNPRSPLFAQ